MSPAVSQSSLCSWAHISLGLAQLLRVAGSWAGCRGVSWVCVQDLGEAGWKNQQQMLGKAKPRPSSHSPAPWAAVEPACCCLCAKFPNVMYWYCPWYWYCLTFHVDLSRGSSPASVSLTQVDHSWFFFSLVPLKASNPILHSVFPGVSQHFADLFPAPQSTPKHPASTTAEFESGCNPFSSRWGVGMQGSWSGVLEMLPVQACGGRGCQLAQKADLLNREFIKWTRGSFPDVWPSQGWGLPPLGVAGHTLRFFDCCLTCFFFLNMCFGEIPAWS